jgi:hypothetical protein
MTEGRPSRKGSSSRDYALELALAAEARRLPAGERRGILDRLRRHGKSSLRGTQRSFYEFDPCTGRWQRL